jgi:hypothetical protein
MSILNVIDPFEIRRFKSKRMITSRITQPLVTDGINQQLASWFYHNNAELDGSPMIYCPDKLYRQKGDRSVWDIHIPIEFRREEFPPVDVYTKFAERQIAVVLPVKGSWDQEHQAVRTLKAYLEEIGVRPDGIPFIRYFNNKTYSSEEELMWEVGVSVPTGTGVRAPFEIRIIDEGLSSYTEVECKEDEVESYWCSFAFLSQSEGYFMNGYPMKIITGELDGKGSYEFRHPVRKKRENSTSLPAFY